MGLYNEILREFHRLGPQLLGVSVDWVWCRAAFAAARSLHFTLLSDFEPKGAVDRQYRVYDDVAGVAERALFMIDGQDVIRWSSVSTRKSTRAPTES